VLRHGVSTIQRCQRHDSALHLAVEDHQHAPHAHVCPGDNDWSGTGFTSHLEGSTAAEAQLQFILRDFELDGLNAGDLLRSRSAPLIRAAEPRARISCGSPIPEHAYWLKKDDHDRSSWRSGRAVRWDLTFSTRDARGHLSGSNDGMGIRRRTCSPGCRTSLRPQEWIIQDVIAGNRLVIELAQQWASDERH